jgi:hypothetical protein
MVLPIELSRITISSRSAVALDVRGTLIDPVEDEPISATIADSICRILRNECPVGIVTATSLRSLESLVLVPILRRALQPADFLRFILYVDSSTAAYSITASGSIVPLLDFEFLVFTSDELRIVKESIKAATSEFRVRDATDKIKAGQVNFYCGGEWSFRRAIADYLNQIYRERGSHRLIAMVPTAKATIDIALCTKRRGIQDLIFRTSVKPCDLLIVGDSFQRGGADLDMVSGAPGCLSIQVGPRRPDDQVTTYYEGEIGFKNVELLLSHLASQGV